MRLQGYRTTSGNYITKKELEQRHKKHKKELAELRKQRKLELLKEEEYKIALHLQEKKEIEEEKAKMQRLTELKIDFMNNKINSYNLPYNQFLIVYDLMNYNIYQVVADYQKGKIDKKDITKVLNIIPAELLQDQYIEAITELQ